MGRRPYTTKQLKAKLAELGDDLNDHHAGETFEDIPEPEGLGDVGLAYWHQNARKLFDCRKLRVESAPLLISLCNAMDDEHALSEAVRRDGRVIENSRGEPMLHPAVKALATVRATVKANANALGIGPLAEGRVVAAPVATEEEDEEAATLRKFNIA
jgi:P27 family predicted phage terminase small subunit